MPDGSSFLPRSWVLYGLLITVAAALVAVLEGWRQSRKLKSGDKERSRGTSMMAAGVLELQGILQPDRHVEEIQAEVRDHDRLNPAHSIRKEAEGEPGNGEPFVLVPAEPDMAEALSALAYRSKSHWNYPAAWLEEWRDELTVSAEYLAANWVQVALKDDRPVGFCALEGEGHRLELGHLWIDPAYMGLGLGRCLVAEALRQAAGQGATEVLVVADPNAEPFYRRLGAQPGGYRPAPVAGEARELPILILPVPEAVTD
jgi:ribosomal protein S18 acetylase RimI-like enzyme